MGIIRVYVVDAFLCSIQEDRLRIRCKLKSPVVSDSRSLDLNFLSGKNGNNSTL